MVKTKNILPIQILKHPIFETEGSILETVKYVF